MSRMLAACASIVLVVSPVSAQQPPSYARHVKPFLAKYCLECHNARVMKGTLALDTYKALMEGTDVRPVIEPGKPDKSILVLLCEHKEKPTMPPPKARFQPTKDEVKMLRAWVAAGAKDDSANVKVELPAIKPRKNLLPPVTALAYEPKAKLLMIARNNRLTNIHLRQNPPLSEHMLLSGKVTALILAADGFFIAVTEPGKNAEVLVERSTGFAAVKWPVVDTVLDLAYTQKRLAGGSYDGQINIWPDQHHIKEHSDAVHGLAFSPDGKLLASVSADRAMKVFDVEKGKLLYTLGEATDWLYAVAWSPDGKYLVSGGVDKSIRVYEPTPTGAKLRQSVFAHEGPVQKLVFAGDSRTLYSVGQDRVVKAWDVARMVERKVYDPQPETVLCLALREDAGQIIVGRYDGVVQLIDIKTGKVAHEFGKEIAPKKTAALPRTPGPQVSAVSSVLPEVPGHSGKTGLRDNPKPGASPTTAQKITPPTTLAATLDRAGAVHYFRFDAKKGQPLGIQLTKDAAAKLDPVLILSDMSGRILAESYEGHLGHTFAEAGSYAIGVRDREYRGGGDFKYQLKLGEIPIVTSFFPMGMRRGTKGDIQLTGVFLPKKTISVSVPADAKPGQTIPLSVGDGVLGKAQIVVGELPEITPGQTITGEATANGRLTQDNQKDVWAFSARKGQRLIVEVNARRIGSKLDSIIEILDKDNQPVPRAVLRSLAKTYVTFRDHDSVQGNIRIEAWSELATNDYLYVGNELMKIQALPTHPDADCNFFATGGQRIAHLDTTSTHHANNTPMYKVSIHPPGTSFPPNGYPVFTLYYRNDDGGPGCGRDSRIIFDPPADGQYKVRIADARGMGGENFGYRLTIRSPKPHFTLSYTPARPMLSKGSAVPIAITATRIDGYDGPINVAVKNLPPGFSMPATTIEAGTYTTTVPLFAEADAKQPEAAARPLVEGSSHATGMPFASLVPFEAPKLIEPGDIVTTTAESEVAIKPGQQTKLTVRIERRNGFTGRVPLDVKGLPHGVRVLDIGLNGILITERETMRTIALYAEPWVEATSRPFVVLAKREGKNTEHAAKAVMLHVR